MNKKFITDINKIKAAIDTKKLVVFAGAGISVDSGVPTWGSLVEELRNEIDVSDNEQDFLRLAQMYFNERQQKEYIEKIRTILKHKQLYFNEIHEEIFRLSPEHILTTNYDDLLDQVINKRSLPYSVVSRDKEFTYASNTKLLLKIHGDLGNTDIVLKEDDYLDYSINHPLIESFLKSMFATKLVLFVGYGFSDTNLKMIIQTVRNILGKDFQNAYLLSIDKTVHHSQRQYLRNRGINVVNFNDARLDNSRNYIMEYLNGANAVQAQYYKKGAALMEKGQTLLNFLHFITVYDRYNAPLNERNVIDQVFDSLNRFSEFQSLPPIFLANLFPFNIYDPDHNNYSDFGLLTRNKQLFELFNEQVKFVDDEVQFCPPVDLKFSDIEIRDYRIKLFKIIEKFNYSLIFKICLIEDPNALNKRYEISDSDKILKVKVPSKCMCLNCRLNRFEYSNVLEDVYSLGIDQKTSINSDLSLAYVNFQVGNFHQSYKLFQEVANKTWQAGKYMSYYICKYNLKALKGFIVYHDHILTEEEKDRIKNELNQIDFDQLLSQIPFLGDAEIRLLRHIRDNDILLKAARSIEEIHKRISEIYTLYKHGRGSTVGPYYPEKIEIELYKVVSFYLNNYIIKDESGDFINVCKRGVEALLISFATSNEYESKLKRFNSFFFDLFVRYCEPDKIKNIIVTYNISFFEFEEDSIHEIVEEICNFFESFYEINTVFKKVVLPNSKIKYQLNNSFFIDKCRKQLRGIFLALSYSKFEEPVFQQIIVKFSNFIKKQNFLKSDDFKFINDFLLKQRSSFKQEDLSTLFESIKDNIEDYSREGLLRSIAIAYKKNNYIGTQTKDSIGTVLTKLEGKQSTRAFLVPLWIFSDQDTKKEIKEVILRHLGEKFDHKLYVDAVESGIIDYMLFFNQYIDSVNNSKGSGAYSIREGKPIVQNFTFINAMRFLYSNSIGIGDIHLDQFSGLSNYMKFYVDPENFN